MPRAITTHESPGLNAALTIMADEPGVGGASHSYRISWRDRLNHLNSCDIDFQKGGIAELRSDKQPNGVTGVSKEALVAIVIDQLEGFQSGEFACADNAEAIQHFRAGLEALHRRTKGRVERGVEGTHQA